MCGIYGIVRESGAVEDREMLSMSRAIAHRGPDDDGFHLDGSVGLGTRRLSIVDHAGGAQPMRSARDRGIAVTFNGEIYGYRELRRSLPDYPFRTSSDTELILALYETYGLDFLDRLAPFTNPELILRDEAPRYRAPEEGGT